MHLIVSTLYGVVVKFSLPFIGELRLRQTLGSIVLQPAS